MPPKVKSFIWWACSNILPIRESLQRRRVKVNARCELCFQQLEFVGHLLWECPFVRNVWALCSGKIQKCANEATDFFFLFQVLAKRLSKPELEKWAMVSGGFGMHAINFILRRSMPIPKPSRTGLLFSCMNTRTLWLHKEILDTHCRVLLLHAVGYCYFFFSSALVFLHWIVATCSVWAAVFLFYTNFPFGTGFSWQHWF